MTPTPPIASNPADWIALLDSPLPAGEALARVADARAGGVGLFLGTTRADRDVAGRALLALDYEAYAPMADRQLHDLARRARERWPVVRLVLLHRTGRVPLADASVLIAVSTPHRAEAFEACRWLIDTLKAELAVWKKEIWAGGDETWVEGNVVERK